MLLTLLLSENKLGNCAGIAAMPKLLELNLSGNALTSISDLKGLGSLKKLDVARNKLAALEDFPELPEPYNNLAVLYASQSKRAQGRFATIGESFSRS